MAPIVDGGQQNIGGQLPNQGNWGQQNVGGCCLTRSMGGHNQRGKRRGRGKERGRGRWQRGNRWYRGYGMEHNYNFNFF